MSSDQPGAVNKARKELALTQDRLRQIQRVARFGFWDWDIASGNLYWSDEIYTIFGLPQSEYKPTYQAFLEAVHPEDREKVERAVEKALADNARYEVEHRVKRLDGHIIHVREEGEVICDVTGKPSRMLGTVVDVTRRRRAEEASRESEQQFRIIWESVSEGMMTVDDEGVISRINPAATNMFGYAKDELLGQQVEILVPPHLRQGHVTLRRDYQLRPESYHRRDIMDSVIDLAAVRKDGKHLPVRISLIPVVMQGVRETLLTIVETSTRQLLERKLRQAEKLEAIGRLAGGIAHDLNNILTAVIGYTDLCATSLGPSHHCQIYLREVAKGGDRAKKLVGNMLAFTRQQVLEPRLLDINVGLKDMEKMLLGLIKPSVDLVLDLKSGLHLVYVDPIQLVQVMTNLVVNADHAMPAGGRLLISTNNLSFQEEFMTATGPTTPGRYVEVLVNDSGEGISEKMINKIFDPFFTTKTTDQGTGLGLSTVYGIMRQSRGAISVFSKEGLGTTFRLFFPVADSRILEQEVPVDANSRETGNEMILVVDDDAGVRSLVKRILVQQGYGVLEASDPDTGLDLLESCPDVRLVISDVVMGGMSGHQMKRLIQSRYPHLRVLLMSGYITQVVIAETDDGEQESYLAKPFTGKKLVEKVQELLSKGS